MQSTFLWHDFETTGANPCIDRPVQFAAVRTDEDLNIIEPATTFYCKLPLDYVPHLQASLVTGITPQEANNKGLDEPDFCRKIHQLMSQPHTCNVGYNSIRFDDEVSRYMFYRNFHDPYAREWKSGCSRWDIIDLVRACYALKPDTLTWPYRDNGAPSFKLEDLSKANGLIHENAHDALSDVYATIEIAKLIKSRAPALYEYMFQLRSKHFVSEQLQLDSGKPLLHISSKVSSQQGCATLIVPIASHPTQSNSVICVNLDADPTQLEQDSLDTLREDLYSKKEALEKKKKARPGLKLIHLNKSPFIAPAKSLTPDIADRLGIDLSQMRKHYDLLLNMDVTQKLSDLYAIESEHTASPYADEQLYGGGFISNTDRQLCNQVITKAFNSLESYDHAFTEDRLHDLFFLYKARHYSDCLTEDELARWKAHLAEKLFHPPQGRPSLDEMIEECRALLPSSTENSPHQKHDIIQEFYDYLINFKAVMQNFIEMSSSSA